MKLRIFFLLFLFNISFAEDIDSLVKEAPFVIYAPSWKKLNEDLLLLMKKFYDKNFSQMKVEFESQSKANFGVNIFNDKELDKIGINVDKPLVYSHYSNDVGYLLLPVKSQKVFASYVNKNLKELNYKFFGDFVVISKDKKLLIDFLKYKKLLTNEAFQLSLKKLNYSWNSYFVWVESSFLSDVTRSTGVTANINLPYGFTLLMFDMDSKKLGFNVYSGLLSDEQKRFLSSLRQFNANEKINFVDCILSPTAIFVLNINMPFLYKYYQYVDKVDILGIKSFAHSMEKKYGVSLEKDIIFNGDGRLRFIFNNYNQSKNELSLYGVYGLNNVVSGKRFIENLNAGIIKSGEKLYSFDLFTYLFYRYPGSNYSLYYGIIENDLIFATDKDMLTNVVQRIFRKEGGYLSEAPSVIKDSVTTLTPGFYANIDIQALLANLKGDFQLNPAFFANLKTLNISSQPDEAGGYGWIVNGELIWLK